MSMPDLAADLTSRCLTMRHLDADRRRRRAMSAVVAGICDTIPPAAVARMTPDELDEYVDRYVDDRELDLRARRAEIRDALMGVEATRVMVELVADGLGELVRREDGAIVLRTVEPLSPCDVRKATR